jgi:hypothetical protein
MDTEERVGKLAEKVDALSDRMINVLTNKIDGFVGIRNLAGDAYIRMSDGSTRLLGRKGSQEDTLIVDGNTWRLMLQNMGSIKMGYIVRDDSILRPGDIKAVDDEYVSPNMILENEILTFPKLKEKDLKARLNVIDNSHILNRITDILSEIDPKPLIALELVDQRTKILELKLPDNFYSLSIDELKAFAKSKNVLEMVEEIKSVHSVRQEILNYLAEG